MSLLWRYILKNYFKVFFLINLVFISILLVVRSQEIARFAALGSSMKTIALFSLYQIPYILPIAVPVSALISAFLLTQKMSDSSEITAIRSAGLAFREVMIPLYLAGFSLSLCNFAITAELTPYCRMLSKELIYSTTTENPLILLQKDKLLKLKDTYVDIQHFSGGRQVRDLLFAMHNPKEDRLTLFTANKLTLDGDKLRGKKLSLLSHTDSGDKENFDHLTIENNESAILDRWIFSHFIQTHPWSLNHEYLSLKYLLVKLLENDFTAQGPKRRTQTEIICRAFLSLSPFTFTAIGGSFGFFVGRYKKKRGMLGAILLACFALTFFLIGKSFQLSPAKAFIFFFFPHPICLLCAQRYHKKISHGIGV